MNQDKLYEATKKAIDKPLEFTQTLLDRTEKARTPSERVDKAGKKIGACIGCCLLLTGVVQMIAGNSLWGIGTAAAGGTTLLSHFISSRQRR